jgi:hypothetical protein
VGVSERDRAYLERLGRYKAASHADAQARHLALSLAERLQRSWRLYETHRAALPPRDDDPSPLYERARALGLYAP